MNLTWPILFPAFFFAVALAANAQSTYQWDPNGSDEGLGGSGTWNTTNAFWDLVGDALDDGTDATAAYTFLTGDSARFGGTAGTVTVGLNPAANIHIASEGYSFTTATNAARIWDGLVTIAPTGTTTFRTNGNNAAHRFNGGINLNGGKLVVSKSNDAGNGPFTFAGGIGGNGTLELIQAGGTATFSLVSNTYSGSTLLTSGRANVNGPTAFGTSTVTLQGGDLNNTSGGAVTLSNDNPMNWNADFVFVGTNSLNLGAGTVTLGADVTATTTANTLTVRGEISDGGNGYGLAKSGTGTLIIEGATTYTGDTTVNEGVLSLGDGIDPSDLNDESSVIINGDGVLDLFSPGTDIVARLFIDGVQQPAGTWGAIGSGATHETAAIEGDGTLNVTSAPDPILVIADTVTETTNSAASDFSIPVSNNGVTQNLEITAINIGGTDATSFAIDSTPPITIAPGGGAGSIGYTFTPTTGPGTYTATFEVISNDTTQSPKTVTLTITDNPDPWLDVADPVNFVNDGTLASYSIPVSNIGVGEILNITSITAGGSDAPAVSGLTASLSIPAGGSDQIDFTFDPDLGPGTYSFTLTLDSNMPGSPSQIIDVVIEAQDPVIDLSNDFIDLGNFAHNPGPQVFTVEVFNDGGAEDLTITGTPITGAAEFAVTSAPAAIAPGESASIEVTFTPDTGGGRFSGTLAVESNDFFGNIPTVRLEAFVEPAGTIVARFDFDPVQASGPVVDVDASSAANWTTSDLVDQTTVLDRRFDTGLTGNYLSLRPLRESDAQTPIEEGGDNLSTWTRFSISPEAGGGAIDYTGGSAVVDTYAASGLGGTTSADWTLYYSTDGGTTWAAIGAARQGAAAGPFGTTGPVGLSWDLTPVASQSGTVDFILDPSTIGYATNGALSQRRIGFDNLIVTAGSVTPGSGGGTDFASWAAGFGIPNDPDHDATDHDGIPALIEYALGLSPLTADGPAGTFDGATLSFTKGSEAVANADINYAIETSQTLQTGSWSTVTPTTNNATTISYTLPTGQGKIFARLVVTQN